MNQQTPPPTKPVRTTVSVPPDVLAVFQRLASVTGVSQSKAIGDWLADTVDAAGVMVDLMEQAREQPKRVALELRGYALGLSDLTADLLDELRQKRPAGAAPDGKRSAAGAGAAGRFSDFLQGVTPPVGNTGGKLSKKPKK